MEHLKKKKRFSWRDLLYKSLLFVGTVTLIVYFLPRDGKFNYQFDINKPWKYGQLIATFDFPIYKEDAVVKREQDSLMAFFQPYYQLDKNIDFFSCTSTWGGASTFNDTFFNSSITLGAL